MAATIGLVGVHAEIGRQLPLSKPQSFHGGPKPLREALCSGSRVFSLEGEDLGQAPGLGLGPPNLPVADGGRPDTEPLLNVLLEVAEIHPALAEVFSKGLRALWATAWEEISSGASKGDPAEWRCRQVVGRPQNSASDWNLDSTPCSGGTPEPDPAALSDA